MDPDGPDEPEEEEVEEEEAEKAMKADSDVALATAAAASEEAAPGYAAAEDGDDADAAESQSLIPRAGGQRRRRLPRADASSHSSFSSSPWLVALALAVCVVGVLAALRVLGLIDLATVVSPVSSALPSLPHLNASLTFPSSLMPSLPSLPPLPSLPSLPILSSLFTPPSPPPVPVPPPPPPPHLCSAPHLRAVAKRLYDTTPVENAPFHSLPTLANASISPSSFLSHSLYNPAFPSQMYHNVCLMADSGTHVLLFMNAPHLNSSEKQSRWLAQREEQAQRTGERGGWLWQQWFWQFEYADVPSPDWRYLAGTSVVERKFAIHHDRSWNFGHMLSDYVVPYVMNFINVGERELTRSRWSIDRFVVHSGCMEYRSWEEEEEEEGGRNATAMLHSNLTAALPTSPTLRKADLNSVWPVVSTIAPPFHWMFRMVMQEFSGEGRTPNGRVMDRMWHGMRVLGAFDRSEAGEERCMDSRWPEPVCFERLVMPGRQEDRDNRAASDAEDARAMWVIRNLTLQTMGVQAPVHIPFNASQPITAQQRSTIRNTTQAVRARPSTVTHLLFHNGSRKQGGLGEREGARPVPRVLLYGRQDASRRMWVDVEETMRVLSACTTLSLTFLTSMGDLSICEQMAIFTQHDVFIMPHGAAMFGVLWAPTESLVVEAFPAAGVDWTWLSMLVRGIQLDWVRLDGDERVFIPGLGVREGGQDDPFKLGPGAVVRLLEARGMDMRQAWRALNGTSSAAASAG